MIFKLAENINFVMDYWITEIKKYSFSQLIAKPNANSWSIGQTCMHLIDDTNFFIEQIKICVSNNKNVSGEMRASAKTIFENNSFPDKKLQNPANVNIPQPESKQQLIHLFTNLKNALNNAEKLITASKFQGKTKHPGFDYFNATEWLQFAAMHLRHHIKQLNSIEKFLKK